MIRRRLSLALLLPLWATGCTAGGAILHTWFGPPDIDAVYEPQKRSTLVLVENFQDQDKSAVDGDTVARAVGDALHEHAELTVIDPEKVVPLRTEHPADYRLMSIPAVGRSVGADQVVYVNLVESETTADPTGAAVHASATARVRVVDCKTGNVLWPAGEPKGHELSAKRDYDRSDSSHGSSMRAELLSRLSQEIGHLFYKWKPDNEQDPVPGT